MSPRAGGRAKWRERPSRGLGELPGPRDGAPPAPLLVQDASKDDTKKPRRKDSKYVVCVALHNIFTKKHLRSYPDENGNMLLSEGIWG